MSEDAATTTLVRSAPSRDEEHSLADEVVQWIRRRRLELPARIFLEMHLPLLTVVHTAAIFFQPLLSPVFGAERVERLATVLSDRKEVERILEQLST